MSRPGKGARLWLRPARRDDAGRISRASVWIIKDGGQQISTGCSEGERATAERRLADHIAAKYQPVRRERDLSEILIADVINIYLQDVVPGQASPKKAAERADRLLDFFGARTLSEITGALCRSYVLSREGQGRSNKGKGGGAKRDLEDLRAAINHHQAEGLHRGVVRVVLPERGESRKRWLERDEAARLLWICWKTREVQEGVETRKYPLRHLCRFLILGLYTGSRPGAILTASWEQGPGRSWIDLGKKRFYRLAEGRVATNKRQPPVTLAPRLLAHLERWHRKDGGRGFVVTFAGEPVLSTKTALGRACALAGLESVSAYTLRHTAATWLVNKGIGSWDVAHFLGTSPEVVERNYGHMHPDYLKAASEAIGRK